MHTDTTCPTFDKHTVIAGSLSAENLNTMLELVDAERTATLNRLASVAIERDTERAYELGTKAESLLALRGAIARTIRNA